MAARTPSTKRTSSTTRTAHRGTSGAGDSAALPVNEVRLRGRLSGEPETRTLPSGDEVVSFRVVVDRAAPRAGAGARVDTIDCTAFAAGVRRRVLRWVSGDVVEVEGALHRRFYAGAAGRASRYEVEVRTASRAAPARPRGRGTMAG